MSRLKFGNVLICDLATLGAGNKYTIVNAYSGPDIIVTNVPAVINLGLYAEQISDVNGDMKIQIEYLIDDRVVAGAQVEASGLVKGSTGIFLIPPMPIELSGPGKLRIVAKAAGYHNTTLISKSVVIGPIPSPTAS